MIRDLATQTDATFWAIASMSFFMVVFAVVVLRVLTRKKGAYDRQARLPLEDGASASAGQCPTGPSPGSEASDGTV